MAGNFDYTAKYVPQLQKSFCAQKICWESGHTIEEIVTQA